MQNALKGKPARTFNVPEGIVFAKIDAKTGLLPIEESEKTIFECFKEGTLPTEYTQKPNAVSGSEDLFKDSM
jgi:penicillin-binding protein 1A